MVSMAATKQEVRVVVELILAQKDGLHHVRKSLPVCTSSSYNSDLPTEEHKPLPTHDRPEMAFSMALMAPVCQILYIAMFQNFSFDLIKPQNMFWDCFAVNIPSKVKHCPIISKSNISSLFLGAKKKQHFWQP